MVILIEHLVELVDEGNVLRTNVKVLLLRRNELNDLLPLMKGFLHQIFREVQFIDQFLVKLVDLQVIDSHMRKWGISPWPFVLLDNSLILYSVVLIVYILLTFLVLEHEGFIFRFSCVKV